MRLPARAVAVVLLLAGCAGCSAPVLSVRHALPAALPMPAGTEAVRVGRFSVTPAGEQAAAAVLVDALRERLSAHWTVVGDGPAGAKAAEIAGEIRVVTDDVRGTRPIRRYDQATGTWVSGEVPTLVAHGIGPRDVPRGAAGVGRSGVYGRDGPGVPFDGRSACARRVGSGSAG